MEDKFGFISHILKEVLSDIEKKRKRQKALCLWGEIVDKEVFKHTTPVKLAKGILTIEVENSAWLYEIQNKYHQEIFKKAQTVLGEDRVQQIRYRAGVK